LGNTDGGIAVETDRGVEQWSGLVIWGAVFRPAEEHAEIEESEGASRRFCFFESGPTGMGDS